jgi:peptide/nickel transport system permease protein
MAFGIAIPLAMRSARKPDGLVDRMLSGASFGLLSVPPFVMIVLLVLVVSIKWRIPHTGPASFVPFAQNPVVNLMSLALPSFVLALTSFIVYYRVLRADMIATLQEEFITMARSKGISRRRIFWRHAFRPSSVSLIGTAGVNIGGLLAGGFVIQYLLAIPGLGYMLVIGIGSSDFVLVQGIVLFISIFVVLINFLFDFIVTLVDPRIARD